jgi:hypothetical protein
MSSCTSKMPLTSASYVSDQTFRPVAASLNSTLKAIASAANAAFKEVANVEQAPDFGRRHVSVLELKARRFGDDEQVREATERGDDVLGDPGTKESTATEGRAARRCGAARAATSTGLGAANPSKCRLAPA